MKCAHNAKYNNPDFIGSRYGSLVVEGFRRVERLKGKQWFWECRCDCGRHVLVEPCNAVSGHSMSCGCRKTYKGALKHGESQSRLYAIWNHMIIRCDPRNAKQERFARYAGRGICVCDEWNDYETFAAWAKENGYSDNLTLERVDNDGNYCPGNCVWRGRKEQARNRNTTFHVQYLGRDMSLAEACEIAKIPYKTVFARIHDAKWPIDEALSVPVGMKRKSS